MITIYKLLFSSGKSYIGQSSLYLNRIAEHIRMLQQGIHKNKLVQREYSIYGIPRGLPIETVADEDADLYEDYYILKSGNLNIKKPNYTPVLPINTISKLTPVGTICRVKANAK
jgi:hypothetical protein